MIWTILIGVPLVLLAIGGACGWYVRGAYVRRDVRRVLRARSAHENACTCGEDAAAARGEVPLPHKTSCPEGA